MACKITATHCENCGSTEPDDVGDSVVRANDGYSDCCNEIVARDHRDCRNHHADR